MKFKSIAWAAVGAQDFDHTIQFFTTVLGIEPHTRDQAIEHATFRLPSNQELDVFGLASPFYDSHRQPTVGFEVDLLRPAWKRLRQAGAEVVTDAIAVPDWGSFCYVRGPDEQMYEVLEKAEDSPPAAAASHQAAMRGYHSASMLATDLAEAETFFSKKMGLPQRTAGATDYAVFQLASGQYFEIYGPDNHLGWRFAGTVLNFTARDDLALARQRLLDLGLHQASDLEVDGRGVRRFFFHGPDQIVYSVSGG